MKLVDLIRRSARNLGSAKIRTLLTAMAIAVGAFTLTLTLAAGNGVRDYTSELIANNFDPAELIVGRDREVTNTGAPISKPQEYDESVSSLNLGGPNGSLQVKQVTSADVEELRKHPDIERVRESFQINIRYVTRKDQKRYTGGGEVYNPAQKPDLTAGQLPTSADIEPGSVLLPDGYLEPLGFRNAEAALGQEIQISIQRPFTSDSLSGLLQTIQSGQLSAASLKTEEKLVTLKVQAVTKRPATSLSFGILPLYFSAKDARELYDFSAQGTPNYNKFLIVYARVKGGGNEQKLTAVKNDLQSKGYYVMSSKDIQKTITQFVNILQIMVGVFGLITVIASVFGIINTQYISVLERTREIGLMKALGLSRKGVSRLFMIEATWIGFIGGLLGAVGGVLIGSLLNPVITKQLDLGDDLLIFKPLQLVVLILALMLVAAVAGLLPARKAAKLDPIEALRME